MQFRKHHLVSILLFLFAAAICLFSVNCNNEPKKATVANDGKSLSEKYCISCHKYAGPEMLDQETWTKHVLPAMAKRLGIEVYAEDQYVNNPSAKTAITYEDWLKIVDYYNKTAPKVLKPSKAPMAP